MRELPRAVTDLPATELRGALGAPTLFDLAKAGWPPLFVSVLLHGNEVSGWQAVQRLRDEIAERSVMLFVGNVAAAAHGTRLLPGQADFNRVWEGGDTPEAALASALVARVAAARPRLAIDIHNNTGDNPPYAVIAREDARTLAAARAFSPRALLASQPRGVQTMRLARFCTAVTVEVGQPHDPLSIDRAADYMARMLEPSLDPIARPCTLVLFETAARVLIDADALIAPAMQRFNFRTAPRGASLTRAGGTYAIDDRGEDVSERYLAQVDGATVLREPTTIAMYTDSFASARDDCLCYLLRSHDPRSRHA